MDTNDIFLAEVQIQYSIQKLKTSELHFLSYPFFGILSWLPFRN